MNERYGRDVSRRQGPSDEPRPDIGQDREPTAQERKAHQLAARSVGSLTLSRAEKAEASERFLQLVDEWKLRTIGLSLLPQIAMDWAYQEMIGLGPNAVPLILEELRKEPSAVWFWALRAIAGADPAIGADTVAEGAAKWLEWGEGACCAVADEPSRGSPADEPSL